MAKRIFDIVVSVIGILMLLPLFMMISIIITFDSRGPILFRQRRVGLDFIEFNVLKFRSMKVDSEVSGLLTVGNRDSRITRSGVWLRKYKLDELPQLFNILYGDMSFVGPRPEVLKYVNLYTMAQRRVLSVKPGITDWASIHFIDENQLLASAEHPERFYIDFIMPSKVIHNLRYIDHNNLWVDIKIIALTCFRIFSK